LLATRPNLCICALELGEQGGKRGQVMDRERRFAKGGKPVLADVFIFACNADLDLCKKLSEVAFNRTAGTDLVHALDARFLVF
jgi:hypothetical protein